AAGGRQRRLSSSRAGARGGSGQTRAGRTSSPTPGPARGGGMEICTMGELQLYMGSMRRCCGLCYPLARC
ncbi:unnamed protein product, partial [Prorocentrum cordatum]